MPVENLLGAGLNLTRHCSWCMRSMKLVYMVIMTKGHGGQLRAVDLSALVPCITNQCRLQNGTMNKCMRAVFQNTDGNSDM
jgi:hypothetical protein